MRATVTGYYDGTRVIVDSGGERLLHPGDRLVITVLNIKEDAPENRMAQWTDFLKSLEDIQPTEIADHAVEYVRELRDNDRS